jgi:hypothetical protein
MDGSCERWEFVMCITAFAQPIFNRGSESHRSSGTSEGRGYQSLK